MTEPICGTRARPRRVLRPARRIGLSLIELLVVIAILGVLIGLMLPAVQRVRASSQRVLCQNNLRQIGLGIHNFENAHGVFPGMGSGQFQDSTFARILPYIEQDAVARQLVHNQPLFMPYEVGSQLNPVQEAAARTTIRLYLCPADDADPQYVYIDKTLAGTNYVVNAGTGTGTYYDLRRPTDGVFFHGSRVRHTDVTDGLSSTMFVSEALLGSGVDRVKTDTVDPRRHWSGMEAMVYPNTDRPGTTPPLSDDMCMMPCIWHGDRGRAWVAGVLEKTAFNAYHMPNEAMPDCGAFGQGFFKASSSHTNGVNIILGDGSIHFIKNHIELVTWRALASRGTGEALGEYCG